MYKIEKKCISFDSFTFKKRVAHAKLYTISLKRILVYISINSLSIFRKYKYTEKIFAGIYFFSFFGVIMDIKTCKI